MKEGLLNFIANIAPGGLRIHKCISCIYLEEYGNSLDLSTVFTSLRKEAFAFASAISVKAWRVNN